MMVAQRRGKVKAYYAAEGAFYAASVFMLVLWEERRRDFAPMLLHHVATVVLIAMSYLYSCGSSPSVHAHGALSSIPSRWHTFSQQFPGWCGRSICKSASLQGP